MDFFSSKPTSAVYDKPLAEFLAEERVSGLLEGFTGPICRHMRFPGNYISDCFHPEKLSHKPQRCRSFRCGCYRDANRKDIIVTNKCQDPTCHVGFRLVLSKKASNSALYPPEPCDVLALEVVRTFYQLETGTHPSWTNCVIMTMAKEFLMETVEKYEQDIITPIWGEKRRTGSEQECWDRFNWY